MALASDMLHVFLFIIIFVIIHIIIVTLTASRNLKVELKQKIIVDDQLPVIKLRSARSEDMDRMERQGEEERRVNQWYNWEQSMKMMYQNVFKPFHLKYKPIDDWPANMDNEERWQYFKRHCALRNNITEAEEEVTNCAFDSEMYRRRKVIEAGCKRSEDSMAEKQHLNPYRLFAMVDIRLVWCPVYKAASTNWMKNIPRLVSTPEEISEITRSDQKTRQGNVLARKLVPLLPTKHLVSFLRSDPKPIVFLIVRHPFDRLLSAYRDKLEIFNKYYYNKYGEAIVSRYRLRGMKRFGAQFYKKPYKGSPIPNPHRTGKEPTFWEFVTAVLETGLMDEHWMPAHELCSLCSQAIQYDFVIKYENLEREQQYFSERLEIDKIVLNRWENKNTSTNHTTAEIRDEYFKMLNEDEIWQLYSLYQMDFKLFEYEVDPKYLIKYSPED